MTSSAGLGALTLATLVATSPASPQAAYFPPPGAWERRTPEQVGLDPQAVKDAVALAAASESDVPRSLLQHHRETFGREPHGEAIGPFRDRGPASGVIVRKGYIVAEWGEPDRVDVSFSVTKSFLSTTVGLAHDRRMIRDLDDPVRRYMPPVLVRKGVGFELLRPFESEHNRRITWDHLLRQTSDWQGTLWGKPDWADRPQGNLEAWKARPRNQPGTVFNYNDVRVNLLALASLQLWRRPLPEVLREYVMDPIGASQTWRWYGYDNSWIVLDGELVQSVSGGAHWGGGMFISARDLARFGYLTLRKGKWRARQILSEQWIHLATTPGVNPEYGFMNYFLNSGRRGLPSAPEQAFWHLGTGNNIVYVDPVNDLVVVARWIAGTEALDAVIRRLLAQTGWDRARARDRD